MNIAWIIAVLMLATFLTRVIPFILFKNQAEHPAINYIGHYLPLMIMPILVLYTVASTNWQVPPHGAYELIATFITTIIHLKKRNVLLSLLCGTGSYIIFRNLLL